MSLTARIVQASIFTIIPDSVHCAGFQRLLWFLIASIVQAEVQGQMVTWLMPHSISQVLPKDVDYRVMLTFLEFYHTLLQFVHFKLYHALDLKYPPTVNPELAKASAELAAIVAELGGSQQAAIERRAEAALSGGSLASRVYRSYFVMLGMVCGLQGT